MVDVRNWVAIIRQHVQNLCICFFSWSFKHLKFPHFSRNSWFRNSCQAWVQTQIFAVKLVAKIRVTLCFFCAICVFWCVCGELRIWKKKWFWTHSFEDTKKQKNNFLKRFSMKSHISRFIWLIPIEYCRVIWIVILLVLSCWVEKMNVIAIFWLNFSILWLNVREFSCPLLVLTISEILTFRVNIDVIMPFLWR